LHRYKRQNATHTRTVLEYADLWDFVLSIDVNLKKNLELMQIEK